MSTQDPEGPDGEFFVPFSEVRKFDIPAELVISRALAHFAARMEEENDPSDPLERLQKFATGLLMGVKRLETDLVALRKRVDRLDG